MKKLLFLVIFCLFTNFIFAGTVQAQKSRMHYKLGLSYYERNDIKNAISEFREAVKLNPSNSNIHYSLGTSFLSIGNYVESINSLESSVQYNPNNPDAFYNLGIAYYRTRQYNKSINAFKNAIALNPNDIDYYINLGVIFRIIGKYPEAIIEYQKALFLNPASIPALLNLGVAYRLNGNIDRAIEQYNKVLAIDPNNKEALYNISLIQKTHDISAFQKQPVGRTTITTPQQDKIISPYHAASIEQAHRQPPAQTHIPVHDVRKSVDFEQDFSSPDFREVLAKQFDELRKSIVNEVKEITDSAVRTIQIQGEEYRKAMDDFKKEIEAIKTGQLPLETSEDDTGKPKTQEDLYNEQIELLKNEIRELSFQNRELRNELRNFGRTTDIAEKRRSGSQPSITGSTRKSDESIEGLLKRLGLYDDASKPDLSKSRPTGIDSKRYSETVPSDQRININNASIKELTSLPNITETKANNIVWYRDNIDNFQRADEIIRVPGITLDDMYRLSNLIVY